jgi:hypothetical protein
MTGKPRESSLRPAPPPTRHKPTSVPEAIRLQATAAMLRANADRLSQQGDHTGARWERKDAEDMAQSAADFLDPLSHITARLRPGAGGEMVAATREVMNRKPGIVDTVRTGPDMLAATASLNRLELAADAAVLTQATDAAETIQAGNSLEKMLAHQMAAAHRLAMRFAGQADEELRAYTASGHQMRAVEAARLAGTVAKLMGAYQGAMLTLDRVRRGGQQTVNVVHQHVQVAGGAQALVAGAVTAGGTSVGAAAKGELR